MSIEQRSIDPIRSSYPASPVEGIERKCLLSSVFFFCRKQRVVLVRISQDQIAELYQRDKSVISRHIRNIFAEGELEEKEVVAFFATTSAHGAIEGLTQTHMTAFYNLDVIISVGYRVKLTCTT